jgi:hypothetical protein
MHTQTNKYDGDLISLHFSFRKQSWLKMYTHIFSYLYSKQVVAASLVGHNLLLMNFGPCDIYGGGGVRVCFCSCCCCYNYCHGNAAKGF